MLEREQFVAAPLEETFRFFADARNLERITPPWLGFRVLTQGDIPMAVGTVIDYRIRVLGLPVRWTSLISRWEPGVAFVDRMLRGPYRWWHHLHTFEAKDGGTLMRDRVEYAVPYGPLGPVAHALFVRRRLAHIFDFRRDTIAGLLCGPVEAERARGPVEPARRGGNAAARRPSA